MKDLLHSLKIKWPYFRDSLWYALISIIGSFITIVLNSLYIAIKHERTPESAELFGTGEGIIICIPLLITIVYSLHQEKNKKGFKGICSLIFYISLFLIIISAALYSHFRVEDLQFNTVILFLSIGTIIWTFLSLLGSHYYSILPIDIPKVRESDANTLEEKIYNLNKTNHV